eukprot:TRINITY_DN67290_c5_g1_i1.p1 TRINITY_DN67290_c5_g1~~TRINITY_DN67290_c5_g1_i1.p1  ORF type:complete len:492 (+),score=213.70 TRINITY_DN67290_c5_g1_i1:86-1561(+)
MDCLQQEETVAGQQMQTEEESETVDVLLDGYSILEVCGVESPEQLCRASLTTLNPPITLVDMEQMVDFVNLVHLDLSGNRVPLHLLATLPALEELHLASNDMRHVTLGDTAGEFPHLTVLDLSYNWLRAEDLVELGKLPQLRELDVSCNHMALSSLAGLDLRCLKSLRKLNLRRNYRLAPRTHTEESHARAVPKRRKKKHKKTSHKRRPTAPRIRSRRPKGQPWLAQALRALATIPQLRELDLSENRLTHLCGGATADELTNMPPHASLALSSARHQRAYDQWHEQSAWRSFLRLTTLKIGHNRIEHAHDLGPLAAAHSLRRVDVRANPFVPKPPVVHPRTFPCLFEFFVQAHGITVIFDEPKPVMFCADRHVLAPKSSLHSSDADGATAAAVPRLKDLPKYDSIVESKRTDEHESLAYIPAIVDLANMRMDAIPYGNDERRRFSLLTLEGEDDGVKTRMMMQLSKKKSKSKNKNKKDPYALLALALKKSS